MKTILLKIWKGLKLPTNIQLFAMRRVNDQFLIGITGIIFDKNGEILLVKHSYRDIGKWSLPGGYLKAKEHPKEGLEREIEEETGLIVSADERLKIRTDRRSPRLDIVYIGTLIGGEFRKSEETQEIGFFSFNTLPQISNDQLLFIERALKVKH